MFKMWTTFLRSNIFHQNVKAQPSFSKIKQSNLNNGVKSDPNIHAQIAGTCCKNYTLVLSTIIFQVRVGCKQLHSV